MGLLGRHIFRRADAGSRPCQVGPLVQRLGDAKIGQQRATFPAHEHVCGLDVAVDDTLAVRVVKRIAQLGADRDSLIHRHGSPRDQLLESTTFCIVHHDIVDAVGHPGIVDVQDIGVAELGHSQGLPAKAGDELLIVG